MEFFFLISCDHKLLTFRCFKIFLLDWLKETNGHQYLKLALYGVPWKFLHLGTMHHRKVRNGEQGGFPL